MINLLLSLSSSDSKSVVGLSDSALFEHSYSSISQCVSSLGSNMTDFRSVLSELQCVFMRYYPVTDTYSLQTDTTPITKPHSAKLSDRQYVNVPNNVIHGNKSLDIGYNYSYINLGYTPPEGGSRWSLPLSVERVLPQSDAITTALVQMSCLMTDEALPFGNAKQISSTADSGYFTPRYLAPLIEKYDNVVPICRSRHGSKVWQKAEVVPRFEGQRGTNSVYAKKTHYLIGHSDVKKYTDSKTQKEILKVRDSVYDIVPTQTTEFQSVTSRGRNLIIRITRWDNMMIRSKKGNNMKDKPFNLFGSQVIDAQTGELIFQRPMFIGVFGELKGNIDSLQAHQAYRNRYDIEGHNRFSSHQLLLNGFQTPNVSNLDNWTLVVAMAYWLLFVAADEVDLILKPWERNLPKNKAIFNAQKTQNTEKKAPKKSIAQTKKGAFSFFHTFDRKAFSPKSVKNGKGRKTGTKIAQRLNQKVVKKQNKSNFANKTQNNE